MLFFFFLSSGGRTQALHMLGKHSPIQLTPTPNSLFFKLLLQAFYFIYHNDYTNQVLCQFWVSKKFSVHISLKTQHYRLPVMSVLKTKTYVNRVGRMAQVMECMPNKCEVLSSNSSTTKKICKQWKSGWVIKKSLKLFTWMLEAPHHPFFLE
jgi:hypothetical protein